MNFILCRNVDRTSDISVVDKPVVSSFSVTGITRGSTRVLDWK